MAYALVLLANFAGLTLAVWLGVYIVTHSRRSWIAWNAGFTLWSLAGLFATILLLVLSSPAPVSQPAWLRWILPFWPQESSSNITGWTQGWAASLGIYFWYQTTASIIPGKAAVWRRWSHYLAFAIGLSALLLQIFAPQVFQSKRSEPLLVDTQTFFSIYPVLASFLLLYSGLSILNLIEARRRSASLIIKQQINPLIAASILASLATILSILGAVPGFDVPVFLVSSILVIAVGFFGFGVTRYGALLGHRILRRDLAYSATAIGLVVMLYSSMFLWLMVTYQLPQGILVYLIPLVILSHSITEEVRQVLERLIYDRKTRTLRTQLKNLNTLAGEQANLSETLSLSLEAVCFPVRATYGVILVFDEEQAHPTGTYRWHGSNQALLKIDYLRDDVCHLEPGSLPEPFLEVTLLIPLYTSMEQIGALLLGRPDTGVHYTHEDVQLLQDPAERITDLIVRSNRITAFLDQLIQMPLQPNQRTPDLVPAAWVEDAMQNLYDYAYLSDSSLASLKQISSLLDAKNPTHIDLGKAVNQAISSAIEKLRPDSALPASTIPRQWFPYIILHDAYIDGLPNREIMAKLYISEGTFHRTRRSAIRSVARVLSEIEMAQQ